MTEDNNHLCWHVHPITRQAREHRNGHCGAALWFTGLSGCGKSTIAGALEQKLYQAGIKTYLLDGDNVRHGLCRDLGFSEQDRKENIRRVGEVTKLMVDAGLIVLTAFISPHRSERQWVRENLQEGQFLEVFVDTPLAVCEARDPKGLYKKARAGELRHFTGIDAIYEAPLQADIHLDGQKPVTVLTEQVMMTLRHRGIIHG